MRKRLGRLEIVWWIEERWAHFRWWTATQACRVLGHGKPKYRLHCTCCSRCGIVLDNKAPIKLSAYRKK